MPSAPPPDDWRSPWLRVNLLLRDLTKLYRVREARAVLKEKLNRAVSMKAAMKAAPGWVELMRGATAPRGVVWGPGWLADLACAD